METRAEKMILRMSFEELTALNSAAERLRSSTDGGGVAAPPELLAELETRMPLGGDIAVMTLGQQVRLLRAIDYVLDHQKRRMDALVVEQYVGSDDSVNAYFDYANVLTLRERLEAIGRRMRAMVELMTGGSPTAEVAETIEFPD